MCQDCIVLHEKLQQQNYQMWQMKRAIINLRGEVKYERREKDKLIRERKKNQKSHYKNGKRGTNYNG